MIRLRTSLLLSSFLLAAPLFAQTITGGTCTAATLTGTYSMTLNGRSITAAGAFAGSTQGIGSITFDGVSKVTMTGTANSNLASGKAFTYSGTYTLPSNCYGTVTLTTGDSATFAIVVWTAGKSYQMVGSDATYMYSAGGTNALPVCATSTFSGEYTYQNTGFVLSGTTQAGAADESGVLQFDGAGNVTASYSISSSVGATTQLTATGTYTVNSNCLATGTLTDSAGKPITITMAVNALYGQAFNYSEASSTFVRSGNAHSAFENPSQYIGNVASYAVNSTPPGSVFVLFGNNLAGANKSASTPGVPLPTTLLTTKVTVNGEAAPLFYVDSGQIDAQMPWDIPGGTVANVVVTNGTAASNTAAVYVPASGTPGISVSGNNRAVVTNADGTVNTATNGAKVGDEVVAYFTGGGPVQTTVKLVSGAASPGGLIDVTGLNSITVGTANANVIYMGLTPLAVGLYQANFIVPQVAKGNYPVVITIGGTPSNNPVMTVTN